VFDPGDVALLLAFPYRESFPSQSAKLTAIAAVAPDVLIELSSQYNP